MKELANRDRNLVALAAAGGIFVLFLAAYYVPRMAQLRASREALRSLTSTRQEVSILLPQVAETMSTAPEPAENVRAWLSTEALKGIEKQATADGYAEGSGAKVKLRRLTAQQAAKFLSQLTKAKLVVERMQLQDSDGDGRWDMEIDVRVPQKTK